MKQRIAQYWLVLADIHTSYADMPTQVHAHVSMYLGYVFARVHVCVCVLSYWCVIQHFLFTAPCTLDGWREAWCQWWGGGLPAGRSPHQETIQGGAHQIHHGHLGPASRALHFNHPSPGHWPRSRNWKDHITGGHCARTDPRHSSWPSTDVPHSQLHPSVQPDLGQHGCFSEPVYWLLQFLLWQLGETAHLTSRLALWGVLWRCTQSEIREACSFPAATLWMFSACAYSMMSLCVVHSICIDVEYSLLECFLYTLDQYNVTAYCSSTLHCNVII